MTGTVGTNPGVLSDTELEYALEVGHLTFFPKVSGEQVQPCSIDLRLGGEFIFEYGAFTEKVLFSEGNLVTIPSGAFVLATTVEQVVLNSDLVAFVSGRSSVGRTGLFVENAGLIDPGFSGQITLELFNASRFDRQVRVGSRICQISVERLASPAQRPYGHASRRSKYQHQQGATASRWEELDNTQPFR